MPPVDCQGQRAAHANIVERFSFVVWRGEKAAVPVTGLYRDLVAERADQLVAGRRREAAEFDCPAVAADRIETGRLLRGQDPDDFVEIRQPLVIIIRVAYPFDRLAGLVAVILEWARTLDVLLVSECLLYEDYILVN